MPITRRCVTIDYVNYTDSGCLLCDEPLTGRHDQLFCSDRCQRNAANRIYRLKKRASKMDPKSDEFFDEALEYSWLRPEVQEVAVIRPGYELYSDAPVMLDRIEALKSGLDWSEPASQSRHPVSQRVLKSDSDIIEAESYGDWSTMLNHAERMMMDARGYITKGAQGHRQSDPLVDNDPRQM